MRSDDLSELGEMRMWMLAPEQEAAELCLEQFDGTRQRRLGDVAEPCGAREIALGADSQEISDLVHLHNVRPLARMWPIARKGLRRQSSDQVDVNQRSP